MRKKRKVVASGSISFRTNGANDEKRKRKQHIRLEKVKSESEIGEPVSGVTLAIDGQGFSRLPNQGRELLCDESAECVILGHLRKFFGFRQGPRLKAGMAVEVLSIEGNTVRSEPDELLSGLLRLPPFPDHCPVEIRWNLLVLFPRSERHGAVSDDLRRGAEPVPEGAARRAEGGAERRRSAAMFSSVALLP